MKLKSLAAERRSGALYFMKIIAVLTFLVFIISCAPQKEISLPPKEIVPPSLAKKAEPEAPSPKKYITSTECFEDTMTIFNSCGIEVLPFIRPVFFDIDNDGKQEMIAGTKNGTLYLYKNIGTGENPRWSVVENYFEGIKAGSFSSPAIGDIDNDGKAEVLIGTGGFSSDSGKVIFYKNKGSTDRPVWEKMDIPEIKVGNDATPALFDVDNDGRTDLIVGNSTGNLFLFRNKIKNNRIFFEKDPAFFNGINLGMYAIPAVTSANNRIIVIVGNSMGKMYMLEKNNGKSPWVKSSLNISFSSFAAPTFIGTKDPIKKDLVVSNGDGQLYYFKNRNGYKDWEGSPDFFSGRIVAGPACTPAMTEINSRSFMAVGNIYGEIKLFEYSPLTSRLPWVERQGFFKNIKLPGFSRGIITDWQGKTLLITGQQNGFIRAFLNSGTWEKPVWIEQKKFFGTIPKMLHAAPAIFDIDGDGKWELIVGDTDGYVRGFRYETGRDGAPVWKPIDDSFRYVKVERYATPSIFKYEEKLYMLVGQQDGMINIFKADIKAQGSPVFYKDGYIRGVQVNNHSSPSAFAKNGLIEMSIGDYNGNLKHFICRNDRVEAKDN